MQEEEKVTRPDLSKVKPGQKMVNGRWIDEDGNEIDQIPMRSYTKAEYEKALRKYQRRLEKPGILLWEDIDAMEFPDNRWRIKNLIPKDGMTILASVSGEGKTWIALELARCISTGKNFLDEDQFKTIQGKVLYIDAENSESEIQRRGRQLSFVTTEQLLFQTVNQLNLNDEENITELISLIEAEDIKVIIVDTFRAVAGGLKEEKAEEVRTFFGRFKQLKGGEISIVWLDHYRKPNNFEGKVPKKEFLFGSQDKTASIETLIMMKKEDDDITVYQRKNRLGKEVMAFKITLVDTTDSNDSVKTTISYGGEIDEKESKKDLAKEYIPELLRGGPKTTPEIVEILYKEKKIAERNTREALKELVSDNAISKRRNGRKDEYFLPTSNDITSTHSDDLFDSF